jgi:dihydroorotate dehydrogenase electron transfer subunit
MFLVNSPVEKCIELENQIFLLKIYSPEIAQAINPGEFLNVRVSDSVYPLLRRPFSVCDVEGDYIFLMFNILGEGTRILAKKQPGDTIDLLGPLGRGFNLNGVYKTVIIVAGGLGVAPFPYVTRVLNGKKNIYSFIGGKTKRDVITYSMQNVMVSTDDGSLGFKGNVVDLLEQNFYKFSNHSIKILGCGPGAMLHALKKFCKENKILCEVSTECAMACGFGICQGCTIPSAKDLRKYLLVCKDGPVFNTKEIII